VALRTIPSFPVVLFYSLAAASVFFSTVAFLLLRLGFGAESGYFARFAAIMFGFWLIDLCAVLFLRWRGAPP
jgi:hypothetical protein